MYFYLYHDLYFIYVLFVCFYEITVFDYFAQTHNVVVILVVFTIPNKLLFSWPFWVNLDSYIAPGLRDLARWSIFKLLPPLSLIYTQQLKLKLFPCLKYIIQSVPSWRLLFCYFLEHTKKWCQPLCYLNKEIRICLDLLDPFFSPKSFKVKIVQYITTQRGLNTHW